MFDTALTANDLVFLAKGAGMTLLVTAISVFFGTILGTLFGVIRYQIGPWWATPMRVAVSPSVDSRTCR